MSNCIDGSNKYGQGFREDKLLQLLGTRRSYVKSVLQVERPWGWRKLWKDQRHEH